MKPNKVLYLAVTCSAIILVLIVVAGLIGYWILRAPNLTLPKRGRESHKARDFSGLTFLPLLPLASAVSWEHHLVILLPLVWVLIARVPSLTFPRKWGREMARLGVLGVALLCLLAIPHLPIGPPYASDFARAAHTTNPPPSPHAGSTGSPNRHARPDSCALAHGNCRYHRSSQCR